MEICDCTIDDIAKLCGENNAAGLQPLLSITCIDEVATIPARTANTHEIAGNITMRAAAVGPPAVTAGKFRKWNFDYKDATYSSEQDKETGVWNTEVKIFVPKMKKGTTYTFSGLQGDNHIAIIEDFNAEGRRLIGDKIKGCMVSVKETTTPKNGYEVSITWTSAEAPLWYSGTITY